MDFEKKTWDARTEPAPADEEVAEAPARAEIDVIVAQAIDQLDDARDEEDREEVIRWVIRVARGGAR